MGVCLQGGSASEGGYPTPIGSAQPWGVCIGGVLHPRGVCPTPRMVCLTLGVVYLHAGVCATPGVCIQGGLPNLGRSASRRGWADPTVTRMTHMCKNITLPQTSFVGGKNINVPEALPQNLEAPLVVICSENLKSD